MFVLLTIITAYLALLIAFFMLCGNPIYWTDLVWMPITFFISTAIIILIIIYLVVSTKKTNKELSECVYYKTFMSNSTCGLKIFKLDNYTYNVTIFDDRAGSSSTMRMNMRWGGFRIDIVYYNRDKRLEKICLNDFGDSYDVHQQVFNPVLNENNELVLYVKITNKQSLTTNLRPTIGVGIVDGIPFGIKGDRQIETTSVDEGTYEPFIKLILKFDGTRLVSNRQVNCDNFDVYNAQFRQD